MREFARMLNCALGAPPHGEVVVDVPTWNRMRAALATGAAQAHLAQLLKADPDHWAARYDGACARHESAMLDLVEDPHGERE